MNRYRGHRAAVGVLVLAPAGGWLDVPFDEKDAAKAAGARWDATARRWYAPQPGMPCMQQWSPLPLLLPGEDRSFGGGLHVDLIPSSCWFTNVRSCVSARDWDRLRQMIYRRAGQRCEACKGRPNSDTGVWLEAHERWEYLVEPEYASQPDSHRQVLTRLVCLCNRCHEASHFGAAQLAGYADRALTHLMQVNQWTRRRAEEHVEYEASLWQIRSQWSWQLDLAMLTGAGIHVGSTPEAAERATIAAARIAAERPAERPATAVVTQPAAGPRPVALPLPPAGWYSDPAGSHVTRWWDGQMWTDDVADGFWRR